MHPQFLSLLTPTIGRSLSAPLDIGSITAYVGLSCCVRRQWLNFEGSIWQMRWECARLSKQIQCQQRTESLHITQVSHREAPRYTRLKHHPYARRRCGLQFAQPLPRMRVRKPRPRARPLR